MRYLLLILLMCLSVTSQAYDDDIPLELRSFERLSLPIDNVDEMGEYSPTPRILRQQEIIPYIQQSIPQSASYIISNPEQVFCYHVASRSADKNFADHQVYTLNGTIITGFCGELTKDRTTTIYEALFTQSPNILTQKSNCKISPQIMLRFVRGVDVADVLLSQPCPSITIFYAGRYKSFNVVQEIIADVIRQVEKTNEPFYSPALLKQTVANATPTNTEEEEMIEKQKRESEDVIDFFKKNKEQQTESKPQESGWGNINIKKKQR